MATRITNFMMTDNFKRNMQANTQKVDKFMGQLASNRRIVRLSDDPIGVLHALNARTSISNYEQYERIT